jgi:hypothetical protein
MGSGLAAVDRRFGSTDGHTAALALQSGSAKGGFQVYRQD